MTENRSGRINRGARRRLFPPENDRDTSRDIQDLDHLVQREEESAARAFESRWNFNVRDETPKPGRYEWEKINSDKSKSSSSVSHFHSSENGSSQKTVVAKNIEVYTTDKDVSTSHKRTQKSHDRDCNDNESPSPQDKYVDDNKVVGTIKRKTAESVKGTIFFNLSFDLILVLGEPKIQ